MPITTLDELRDHVELAIEVELSTIPPYLYAMYSLPDQQSEAALLIRSVVAEEMLHAALAANLLLAIGGEPDFSSPDLMPTYPSDMTHHRPRLTLNLRPCTPKQVEELFLIIEQPETHHTLPDDDVYESLGQFYHAIEKGLATVAAETDPFVNPQRNRQMADPGYYAPIAFDADDSGGLGLIDTIEAANEAIHVIIHQGEGVSDEKWADPSHQELTHYYKFLRIAEGTAPLGELAPVPTNPRAADYPPPVRAVAEMFNAAYRYVYLVMHDIFQPEADRDRLVGRLYNLMSNVLSPIAHHLVSRQLPSGGVAAPTFERYDFGDGDARAELITLGERTLADEPELEQVVGALYRL